MLSKEVKAQIIAEFGKNAQDTGSASVQIALLTKEIENLNKHFETNIHDFSGKRGLYSKIGQRKALLSYLKKNDLKEYENVIKKLGLRG